MTPVFIDFESRSRCDLPTAGGAAYVAHPSTEILCLAWQVDGRMHLWLPLEDAPPAPEYAEAIGAAAYFHGPTVPEPLAELAASGRPFCAHNAWGFDAPLWVAKGLPDVAGGWYDTVPLCRRAGLPGHLDGAATVVFGEGKDADGGNALQRFWKPNSRGVFLPFTWRSGVQVLRYCCIDVALLGRLWGEVGRYSRDPEAAVMDMDADINDRGVAFDAGLADALIRLEGFLRADMVAEVEQATGGELTGSDLRRNAHLLAWLNARLDDPLPNLQRGTLSPLLDVDETPDIPDAIRVVVAARLGVTRITTKKLENGLRRVSPDGRLRGCFVYHGAHTGRWASRNFQLHNMTRAQVPDVPAIIAAVYEALATPDPAMAFRHAAAALGVTPDAALASCIRPCIRAPEGSHLVDYDYSAIEARVVNWLAEDDDALNVYREGRDPYRELASRLFGVPAAAIPKKSPMRQVGKIGELGCGFGAGAGALERVAAKSGIDFQSAGVTAQAVVDTYRDAHWRIAGRRTGAVSPDGVPFRTGGLWRAYEKAAKDAVLHGAPVMAGRCRFTFTGGNLEVALPSGRTLVYRRATVEELPSRYGGNPRPSLMFTNVRGLRWDTYGGKLCENITQAVARDVMVDAMLRLHTAGHRIVMHVHDAIVCEGGDARDIEKILRIAPAWAAGLPIEVEGGRCGRFN